MKAIYIIILLFFISIATTAQLSLQWDVAIGGMGEETAMSAIETPDNGFIIVGSTNSEGSGKLDGYIVKVDANGDEEWSQTYGGKKDDQFNAIIEYNGKYAITGYSESKGSGKKDYWFMMIDSEGNKLWEHFYGGKSDDEAFDLIKTFDNKIVMAGYTKSKGPKKHNFYIVKINTLGVGKEQGKRIWDRTTGSAGTDIAVRIKQSPQDSFIYVLGHTTSYGAGGMDIYFVKANKERGSSKEKKYYGKDNFEHGNDFCLLPDGKFLIVGSTMSDSEGFFDGYMIQIEDEYYKAWDNQYGGLKDEEFMSICPTDNGYVLGGFTASQGEGKYDAWIMEIDKKGNKVYENTFGEEEDDKINKMIQCKDGSYLLVGYTESKGDGNQSMWLVKTN